MLFFFIRMKNSYKAPKIGRKKIEKEYLIFSMKIQFLFHLNVKKKYYYIPLDSPYLIYQVRQVFCSWDSQRKPIPYLLSDCEYEWMIDFSMSNEGHDKTTDSRARIAFVMAFFSFSQEDWRSLPNF